MQSLFNDKLKYTYPTSLADFMTGGRVSLPPNQPQPPQQGGRARVSSRLSSPRSLTRQQRAPARVAHGVALDCEGPVPNSHTRSVYISHPSVVPNLVPWRV